ncbi:MAG: hypothetical protein QOH16_669 [Gaiellaceae bacterium]|nr:hypothetical protein [Gaiellaceae bacterium]
MIAALQESATALGLDYLGRDQYQRWRKPFLPCVRLPHADSITTAFKGWRTALEAAGLRSLHDRRESDQLSYTREPTGLDPDETRALAYVLSLFLGQFYRGERTYANLLCRTVGGLAGIEGPRPGGTWPKGHSVLGWLGYTSTDLDEEWVLAEAGDRMLPMNTLFAFIPPRLWRSLFDLINLGPVAAWDRAQAMLRAWAIGREISGERRTASGTSRTMLENGGLSAGPLTNLITAFFGFMRAVDEMRKFEQGGKLALSPDRDFFGSWKKGDFPRCPRATDLGAVPAQANRDAATLLLIRLVLQLLCAQINALRSTTKGRRRLYRPLRNRAIVAVLAITGLRRHAFNALTVGDVVERFPFPDGEFGPALVPRPGKSLSRYLKRPKGIPQELFEWIKEYAVYAGVWGQDDAPLWLPEAAGRRERYEAVSDSAIYAAVRSCFIPRVGRASESEAIRCLRAAISREHDGRSYSPHILRHAAQQFALAVGFDWYADQHKRPFEHGAGLPATPAVFAHALLDHSMPTVTERYSDVASERGRTKWARRAAVGNGEYVIGLKGARRAPDQSSIRQSEREVATAETRVAEIESQLTSLEQKIANGGQALGEKEIMLALAQMTAFARQLVSLGETLAVSRSKLAVARELEVPVPDYLTEPELQALRDGSVAAASSAPGADGSDEPLPPLRDWADLGEFHWALGGQSVISRETIRRWARGQTTKLGLALGLPPVNGEAPACIEKLSDRKQRVLLDQLDWSRLPAQVQENLEAIRCTQAIGSR